MTVITMDAHYLSLAIAQAVEGIIKLGPEYGGQVGSVLVSPNGIILAQAHNSTIEGKRMHAEELVLQNLHSSSLEGATLYVTMEPCNGNPHHARRHCCEQIVEAGIRRVVVGAVKRKHEGGIDYVRDRGVQVDILKNQRLNRLCDLVTAPGEIGKGLSVKSYRKLLSRWYGSF